MLEIHRTLRSIETRAPENAFGLKVLGEFGDMLVGIGILSQSVGEEVETPGQELLSTRQAADILYVHPHTINRLVRKGRLPYITVDGKRGRRFRSEDVQGILSQWQSAPKEIEDNTVPDSSKNQANTESGDNPTPTLLTSRQAAELLNVHVNTLKRIEGLSFFRVAHRGDRRYSLKDILDYLKQGQQASQSSQ